LLQHQLQIPATDRRLDGQDAERRLIAPSHGTARPQPAHHQDNRRNSPDMVDPKARKIHDEAIIVEGHRDLFEMVRLMDAGQNYPLLNITYPRLKRANISTTFYSICGDSVTHSRGTRQFLKSALENIDMLREEIDASNGKMKLVLYGDDLPSAP